MIFSAGDLRVLLRAASLAPTVKAPSSRASQALLLCSARLQAGIFHLFLAPMTAVLASININRVQLSRAYLRVR